MKRLYIFLLLLLILLLPATAHAYEVGGIYYRITGNEAEVTYRGSSYSQYNEYSGTVVIPSTVIINGTTYSVTSIGEDAFRGCNSLTSVTIPNSVVTIGNSSFYHCTGLASITIGNSVTTIGYSAFYNCTGLTSVTIPNSVISIGGYAFSGCSGLKSLTIPNSVTSIGFYAFSRCSGLTSVIISNSVATIGADAFRGCYSLTSVTIPNSVTSIGKDAFSGCSGLTSIVVAGGNPTYDSRNNCNAIIETTNNTLILGCVNTVIPNTVISIGGYAFSGCSGLTSLTIPNSVATISDGAFSGCSGLASIVIPNSVLTIGNEAFFQCSGLTNVTIPNSVTSIGDAAYRDCSGLKDLYIGDSVKSIGSAAFYNCDRLKNVIIPESVLALEHLAFGECDSLSTVNWNAKRCNGYDYDEYTYYYIEYPFGLNSITHFTFGENVEVIPSGLFTNCHNVTSITWNVKSMYIYDYGQSPFYDENDEDACLYNLKYVTIGDSVKTIPNMLFYNCTNLTSITIPNSVTSIGNNAFRNCSALNEVYSYIKNLSHVTMGSSVFSQNPANYNERSLHVPAGSLEAYQADTKWSEFFGSIVEMEPETILVASIELDVTETEITEGETLQLTATVLPEDATDKTVSWTTSNENVATVDENGLVTAVAPGIVTITANIADGSELSASCTVTVLQNIVLVTSIELDQSNVVINENETLQLTATVQPEDATDKTVTWTSNDEAVATVDSTGLVTAVTPGVVTITATTNDGSDLSASCIVTVVSPDLPVTENAFLIPDTTVMHGDVLVLPVAMTNNEDIVAFQTDIFLPEGFSIVTDEDEEYLVTPSDRMSNDHCIMTNDANNGSVRVVCYTPQSNLFSGNEGDLFYIHIQVPDDAEGVYNINMCNTRLTTTDFSELSIPDASATIEVKQFIPGDVNDSRTVTVTDIVVAAQYILDMNPSPFIFAAADMNADSLVTVTDIMLIAYLVNHPAMNAPLRAPAQKSNSDHMTCDAISPTEGETRTVSIALDNEMLYSAFQLDLNLPEGLTAGNFALTDRAGRHAFDVNTLGNGNIRALCYSPSIEMIDGHEGALFTFDVTAVGNVTGGISVDGIEMVTADCQTVLLDAFTIGVNNATSVNELNNYRAIASIDYFNLAGQRINRPESGVTLVVTTYTDGTRTTNKVIQK